MPRQAHQTIGRCWPLSEGAPTCLALILAAEQLSPAEQHRSKRTSRSVTWTVVTTRHRCRHNPASITGTARFVLAAFYSTLTPLSRHDRTAGCGWPRGDYGCEDGRPVAASAGCEAG